MIRRALLASLCALTACSGQPQDPIDDIVASEEQSLECEDCGGGGGGGGGGGDPGPNCPYLASTCAAGIAATVAACYGCVGVVTCMGCAGAAALTVAQCAEWRDRCVDGIPYEGDPCVYSNACERRGNHCVNNVCTPNIGHEGDRCSTERDCASGLTCLLDSVGLDPRTGLPYGGVCHRPRGVDESCESSADCLTNLICDRRTHKCRAPLCDETIGGPVPGCRCESNANCPADAPDCVNGRCEGTTVIICNCDGTDPPGTCGDCEPTGGGGGGGGGGPWYGGGWMSTCWYFYDVDSYTTCVTYGEQTECETTYEMVLVSSFCS